MRHLLTFPVDGHALAATLDDAGGETGVLMVSGGGQTRTGSHRMAEMLARSLCGNGISCFRFDRRGVGDSDGIDPGFRGSGPDLVGALRAFRAAVPGLRRIVGFGLCDGATALMLHAGGQLDGLILANPWLIEAKAGMPPPAAIRSHYRSRLTSTDGWRRLATGAVSWRKLMRGLASITAAKSGGLADEVASALRGAPIPFILVLAKGDATAIAAGAEWENPRTRLLTPIATLTIDSDSHTFARPGDSAALLAACLDALDRLQAASEASNSISLR